VMWPCNKPLSYGLPFNWDAALAWCPMVSGMQSVLPLLHYYDWTWRWDRMLKEKKLVNAGCNTCNDCWYVV
jgi:hypothetical protein